MKRVKLDKIDRRILKNLQDNGRITNVELAHRVGSDVAGAACDEDCPGHIKPVIIWENRLVAFNSARERAWTFPSPGCA